MFHYANRRLTYCAPAKTGMASINELSVELLEIIFAHLSMLELLSIRRVCKVWREVLKSAPELQRRTFHGFVPSGRLSSGELAKFVCDNAIASRTLQDPSASATKPPQSSATSLSGSSEGSSASLVEITTFAPAVRFKPVFPSQDRVLRLRTNQFREPVTSASSWLEMYLTQPPCNYAVATVYHKQKSPDAFRRWARRDADTGACVVAVFRPEGVRARDVLKAAKDSKIKMKKRQRIDIEIPGGCP